MAGGHRWVVCTHRRLTRGTSQSSQSNGRKAKAVSSSEMVLSIACADSLSPTNMVLQSERASERAEREGGTGRQARSYVNLPGSAFRHFAHRKNRDKAVCSRCLYDRLLVVPWPCSVAVAHALVEECTMTGRAGQSVWARRRRRKQRRRRAEQAHPSARSPACPAAC